MKGPTMRLRTSVTIHAIGEDGRRDSRCLPVGPVDLEQRLAGRRLGDLLAGSSALVEDESSDASSPLPGPTEDEAPKPTATRRRARPSVAALADDDGGAVPE